MGIEKYIALALAVLLAAVGVGFYLDHKALTVRLDQAAIEINQLTAAKAKEEQSRQAFQNTAKACSASVAGLVVEKEKRESWYRGQLKAAETRRNAAEKTAREILTSHRPEGMTECDAARKELDDEIDRRHPH